MDLDDLTRQIIEKSFPELHGREFGIAFLSDLQDGAIANSFLWEQGDFTILVDEFSKKYDEQKMKQIIAHELAHTSRRIKRGIILEWITQFLYTRFEFYRKYEEWKTCELAAKRGYEAPKISLKFKS